MAENFLFNNLVYKFEIMEGNFAYLPKTEFMNGYKREKGREAIKHTHKHAFAVRHVSASAKSLHQTL